jgi:hypothetical protein
MSMTPMFHHASRDPSPPILGPRSRAGRRLRWFSVLAGLAALTLSAEPSDASTATPFTVSPTPGTTHLATVSPSGPSPAATPARNVPTASPSQPAPIITQDLAPRAPAPVEEFGTAPVATTAAARPRAFRTPERAAPPAFVAPQAALPPAETEPSQETPLVARPPSRTTAALVVFRATARTAIQGFDLQIAYPRALGTFAANGQAADCSAGTGALVVANDRGDGQLRLVVASGQALPFPLDVFCRFELAPSTGLDPGAFHARVAEVTSDNKVADPSLLIINVVVR